MSFDWYRRIRERELPVDGREIRIRRLFGNGNENGNGDGSGGPGRAVIIAMDHGLFDGPIPGMEDLPATASAISPEVDGVLLAPGMIRRCSQVFAGRRRPLAVVRLNWNTVYCFHWNYRLAVSVNSYSPLEALAEGMDIALVSLTLQTGQEERDARNVEIFSRLTNQCHQLGIPVIGEYFPTGHDKMTPQQLHENIRIGSRIVAELGADAIKTFNTCDFQAVTGTCPVPVLGLGAEKLPTQKAALELAAAEVAAGASGVVFGRNAIQVPNPQAFQQALCEVVRGGAQPSAMIAKYKLQ